MRATKSLMLLASYSHVAARIVYNGNAVTDVGQPPASLPAEQATFSMKYSFPQPFLKGLAWTCGVVYSGAAYPNSTAALNDPRRYINAPGYAVINPALSYSWRQQATKTSHVVRLSAKNVLNRDYETSRGALGDPRGVFFAYTLSH
jgi:outer membrane receptor protein involved in Fe transport